MLDDTNLEKNINTDEDFQSLEYVYDVEFPDPSLEIVNTILSLCAKDIEHSVAATKNSTATVGSRRYWATLNILDKIVDGLSTYVNERINLPPEKIMILPQSDDYITALVQLHIDWAERNQRFFHRNRPGTTENERTLNALNHISHEVRKGLITAKRKYQNPTVDPLFVGESHNYKNKT